MRVLLDVERDAEPVQITADIEAHPDGVLADPAGEDDRVGPVQLDEVGPEVMAERDVPDPPPPGVGEIQVRIEARGVLTS